MAPIKQEVKLELVSTGGVPAGLSGTLAVLKEINSWINTINGSFAAGPKLGPQWNRTSEQMGLLVNKAFPVRQKKISSDAILQTLGFSPNDATVIKSHFDKILGAQKSGYSKTTAEFTNFQKARDTTIRAIEIERQARLGAARGPFQNLTSVRDERVRSGGSATVAGDSFKASVQGKIEVIIPANQIVTRIEGPVAIKIPANQVQGQASTIGGTVSARPPSAAIPSNLRVISTTGPAPAIRVATIIPVTGSGMTQFSPGIGATLQQMRSSVQAQVQSRFQETRAALQAQRLAALQQRIAQSVPAGTSFYQAQINARYQAQFSGMGAGGAGGMGMPPGNMPGGIPGMPGGGGRGRWLQTRQGGWSPGGLLQNIVTVSAWTAAVSAMYAPIRLAEYSMRRMIDVGLQTARLGQIFRGVGGNATELADDVMKLAVSTGRSTEEALNGALAWSRFGLSRKEVGEATRVSLMAANVAQIPAELASERMAAVYKDYGLSINELEGSLSMLTRTANTSKVTVKELLDAVQVSGVVARQSGMSFAEFQGIIAASVERTSQSGNRMATAFKSVLGSINKPEKQSLLLKEFGVDVFGPKGQMKGGGQILREMFVAYEGMDQTKRRELTFGLGDKQQASRFASMLESYLRGQQLAVDAQLNLNTAQQENARIMESQKANLAALSAEWERYIVRTANRPGGGGLVTGGIGALALGGMGWLKGRTAMAGLFGGYKGLGLGLALGGLGMGGSSLNESLTDLEKTGTNLEKLLAGPMGSLIQGGMFGRIIGGSVARGLAPYAFGTGRLAAFAARGRFFGPVGMAAGAVLGLAEGQQNPGARPMLAIEQAARGDDPSGGIGKMLRQMVMHPIRTFNAAMDIATGDVNTFADERLKEVMALQNRAGAYQEKSGTFSTVSEILRGKGTDADKSARLKDISGFIPEAAQKKIDKLLPGNKWDAIAKITDDLARTAMEEKSRASREATDKAKSNLVLFDNQIKAQREQMAFLDSPDAMKPRKESQSVGPEGGLVTLTSSAWTVAEVARRRLELETQLNATLDKKNQAEAEIVNLTKQDQELRASGIDKLRQRQEVIQSGEVLSVAANKLIEQTPAATHTERLGLEIDKLKSEAAILEKTKTELEAGGATKEIILPYEDEIRKLNALRTAMESPETAGLTRRLDNRALAYNYFGEETKAAGIGLTESERMIASARFAQAGGREASGRFSTMTVPPRSVPGLEQASDNAAVRMLQAEKDLHELRLQLQMRYLKLLGDEKQLRLEISREWQKSLLFSNPGELLTKLSAQKFADRQGGPGAWFAASGNLRQEMDFYMGGDSMRNNRREQGAIRGYFGAEGKSDYERAVEEFKKSFYQSGEFMGTDKQTGGWRNRETRKMDVPGFRQAAGRVKAAYDRMRRGMPSVNEMQDEQYRQFIPGLETARGSLNNPLDIATAKTAVEMNRLSPVITNLTNVMSELYAVVTNIVAAANVPAGAPAVQVDGLDTGYALGDIARTV